MSKPAQRKPPSPSPTGRRTATAPSRPRARFLGFGLALTVGLLLAGGLLFFLRPSRLPLPPVIATTGLDPAVARLITQAANDLRAAPRSATAWGALGLALLHYEFRAETLLAFSVAERLAPSEPRWPYYQSFLLLEQRPADALPKLRRTVALGSNQPDMPRLRLAQLLLERGHLEEAETHFQALLLGNPRHPLAALGLARLRLQQNRLAESTNHLNLCLSDPHTAKAASALLASIEQRLGHGPAAESLARRSEQLPPDSPWPDPWWQETSAYRVGLKALLNQATAWLDANRFDDALPLLATATNGYPRDPTAWYLLGVIRNRQQQGPEAERVLREHLRLSPQSVTGQSQLATALLAQSRFVEAAEVLKRALVLKPGWNELLFNLGYACAKLGLLDEAIRHFRAALQAAPAYLDTYVLLADLLQQRGDLTEARQLLHRLLELNPNDPRAKVLLERQSVNQ